METQEQQAQTVATDIGGQNEAPAAPVQPELNLVDLQNLRAIIDTAARRGAFSAQEMSGVGSVFDRLNAFVNFATPPSQAGQEPGEQANTPQ